MTLTNRLSLFFLTTLAVVLVGFSTALYMLAQGHLQRQAEERLEAALNILVAAAEVGPDGVEWEPAGRRLAFGDQVEWLISDDQRRSVARSGQQAADFFAEAGAELPARRRPASRRDWRGEHWQLGQRVLQPEGPGRSRAAASPPARNPGEQKYPALTITAGIPLEPMRATLRQLTWVLAGLALVIWLLALFAGRALCRRALLPVRRMAVSARDMGAEDLGQRLPTIASRDELEDLNRAFNGLLDRLQDSFERQRRFTGDASHQLRTPLAAILGQIEVALRRDRSALEYRQVLSTVQQQAEHLKRIGEALLFLARADADAQLPEREQLNLSDWLPEHLRQWSEHARAADSIILIVGDHSFQVEAPPALLGELVNILIDNACKYSAPATPIKVRLARAGPDVCLQIEDRGCGISEEELPHLFTPFFRAAETRRRGLEGHGLGLAIAQRLARAFGGVLAVTSRVGHGSCFALRLPSVQRAKDELPRVPAETR